MKYIKSFESHKNSKKVAPINEEFLGNILPGVLNFFKNMWNKAMGELDKIKNPKEQDIIDWIGGSFNPTSPKYILKKIMDDFKKKPDANDQAVMTLIDSILNPTTGALGTQGLAKLIKDLKEKYLPKKGETDHWIVADTQYIFTTVRNNAINLYKFPGGIEGKKVDKPNDINDLTKMNYLPDVKKLLIAAKTDQKKKIAIETWVEKTLAPQLETFRKAITIEELDKNLADKKITMSGGGEEHKVGDMVVYKRDKFIQGDWDRLTDDDKKKPEEGKFKDLVDKEEIGMMKISKIEGDKISFEGVNFTKTNADILMNTTAGEQDPNADLKDKLTKIKGDKEKMDTIGKLVNNIDNPDKMKQVTEILDKE